MPKSRRKQADALLLAEGPQHKEFILLVLGEQFTPGEACREMRRRRELEAARKRRSRPDLPEYVAGFRVQSGGSQASEDQTATGKRTLAYNVMTNALSQGAWLIVGDGRISHRDWTGGVESQHHPHQERRHEHP